LRAGPHACARAIALAASAACVLAAVAHTPACAERLPFRRYDVGDGLAHGRVSQIYQDRKGYLWFATWEGLSRFDGERFVNYGPKDGLPYLLINSVTEDAQGRLWVATHSGGIARFLDDPRERAGVGSDAAARTSTNTGASAGAASARADTLAARRKFAAYRVDASRESNVVGSVLFDRDGTLWAATTAGLYRARVDSAGTPRFEIAVADPSNKWDADAFLDAEGRPCYLTAADAYQVRDGRVARWPRPRPVSYVHGWAGIADRAGHWIVSDAEALYDFAVPSGADSVGTWTRLPIALPPTQPILALARDAENDLWIGTRQGLVKWHDKQTTNYTIAHGLSDDWIRDIFADHDGNHWIATQLGGVCRLAPAEIASFTRSEGLESENVNAIFETRDGRIIASTQDCGLYEIGEREVRHIAGTREPPFNKIWFRLLQDSHGDWWIGTAEGLYFSRGPDLDLGRKQRIGASDGYAGGGVFGQLTEDASGNIWFGAQDGATYVIDCSAPAHTAKRLDLAAEIGAEAPRVCLQEKSGGFWIAPFVGVWRLRDGRWSKLDAAEGITDPDMSARFLFQDHRGWLWIGFRSHGVSMTKEPAAERPRFVNYSTENALRSDAVWAITEDAMGHMHFGTGRGVCELDVETGRTRHFTTAEGLAGDIVNAMLTDRRGFVWAGTSGGISRIDPRFDRAPAAPPPIFIARVDAGGDDVPLAETGAPSVAGIVLPHARNSLIVECTGIDFVGAPLDYQWKLEGVEREWSRPSPSRTVRYARLAAGAYRLRVRAVNEDGMTSAVPAEVAFRVLPPLWARPWFIALCAAAIAGAALAWHRARIRRLLALEAVRRQIATDLHDDVGSGLSQIAILSEVAKREAGGESRGAESLSGAARAAAISARLDEVAELARSMREAMSDIVWAIDPRQDRVVDLVRRMQQVAYGLFASDGCTVEFSAPDDAVIARLAIPPDRKRHIFLVFKEAATNAARHAGATRVRVGVSIADGMLLLEVEDDGRGFEVASAGTTAGHGLASLHTRAAALAAHLAIDSAPGRGTRVALRVPLAR